MVSCEIIMLPLEKCLRTASDDFKDSFRSMHRMWGTWCRVIHCSSVRRALPYIVSAYEFVDGVTLWKLETYKRAREDSSIYISSEPSVALIEAKHLRRHMSS